MQVDILGTMYDINILTEKQDAELKDCDGYCDKTIKKIVVKAKDHIYNRNDTLFHIHQYEPYIPDHSKSYEENAIAQIYELMVGHYASSVQNAEISLEDVPEEYKTEVEEIINSQEKLYTLDEAAAIIAGL